MKYVRKNFKREEILARHNLTHTGEKPQYAINSLHGDLISKHTRILTLAIHLIHVKYVRKSLLELGVLTIICLFMLERDLMHVILGPKGI